jgi:Hypoxia induced protein conserved region
MNASHIIVLVLMLATLGVLVAGVAVMMIGGKTNAKYGNKLMVARVAFQGITVLLIGALMMMGK